MNQNREEPVAEAAVSRKLMELARRVAATDCTVLISGESGTGKEVLARFIHQRSQRASQPFVAVNCAAIPDNMLEAVLFGYERGAFTGAHTAYPGKFEQAQGGTLLLDEISEMPISLQAKLLRVLQEREVERLGGRETLSLDVRVLATTNRHLRTDVASGRFREDLYYRLCVFPLSLMPLRQRRDDILPIAMRLLSARCRPGSPVPAMSADAAQLLLVHPWRGNVRELDNLLQRALVLLDGPVIQPEHICFEPDEAFFLDEAPRALANGPLANSIQQTEREKILEVLREGGASRREVADRLGISPRTLRLKLAQMRAAGLDVPAA